MSKIIFVLGGAKSGKSNFALKLAETKCKNRIYVATAQALDAEMIQRIKKHRLKRKKGWKTIEEPKDLQKVINRRSRLNSIVLIDCLTLWISNLMMDDIKQSEIVKKTRSLLRNVKQKGLSVIFVSNEVGSGVVPDNAIARNFRDTQGIVNQLVAKSADEVHNLIAGIARRVK